MARRLPRKPSDLIELAVKDLIKVERNKLYKLSLDSSWHDPIGCEYETDENGYDTGVVKKPAKVCLVCFAGAVIASTLKTSFNATKHPDDFDSDTQDRLLALDCFRVGNVSDGLSQIYSDEAFSCRLNRKIVRYSAKNSEKFKKQMRELAKDLRRFGM